MSDGVLLDTNVLSKVIKASPSLANTASAEIKLAYRRARVEAELYGDGRWPARCPWPTVKALLGAVRARDRQYRALEQQGDRDLASLRRAPWKSPGRKRR